MNDLDWDMDALGNVERWFYEYLGSENCSVGKPLEIGKVARQSRGTAHITPRGNIDGFRHVLGKFEGKGYIELTGRKNFVVLKKPE